MNHDRRRRLLLRRASQLALIAHPVSQAGATAPGVDTVIATDLHPASARRFGAYRPTLERLYAPDFRPRWFDAQRRPTAASAVALAALRDADRHGLQPADYEADWLVRRLDDARTSLPSDGLLAQIDVALSWGLLRWLDDVHLGRLSPPPLRAEPPLPRRPWDPVAMLRDSVSPDAVAATISGAPPASAAYARLMQARARWRERARTERPFSAANQDPAAIAERLRALDEPAAALPDALRSFQARHGLPQTGQAGPATRAALAVPASRRVTQIELTMERLRWLPEIDAERMIAVNVPEFRLWAYRRRGPGIEQALRTDVIVGRQGRADTPLFIGAMRTVEFSPYWNVPPSIATTELLPALRRDPTLLLRERMELVGPEGPTTEVSPRTLSLLESGAMRLRQKPGPQNALGSVKFVLPNSMNIYLHDTPSRELFERTRRDFSHGCIRVRDPGRLAAFVLEDRPEWTPARIRDAMAAGKLVSVPLARPIPVIVFYSTVDVGDAGSIRFLPDIYGYDASLSEALRTR